MAWLDARGGSDAHRLEAEIANEPQWVVFDDASDEDRWAAYELEDFAILATWWSGPGVRRSTV
jgi:hypothetical protein